MTIDSSVLIAILDNEPEGEGVALVDKTPVYQLLPILEKNGKAHSGGNRPSRISRKVASISSRVFMTNGPQR